MTAIRQFIEMIFGAKDGGAAKTLGAIRTGAEAADKAAGNLGAKLLTFGASGLVLKGAAEGIYKYADSLAKTSGESSKLAQELDKATAAGTALKSSFDEAFGSLLALTLPAVTAALREIRDIVDTLGEDIGLLDSGPALRRVIAGDKLRQIKNPGQIDSDLPQRGPLLTTELENLRKYGEELEKINKQRRDARRDQMSRQSPGDLFPDLTSAGPIGPEFDPDALRRTREQEARDKQERDAIAAKNSRDGSFFLGAQEGVDRLRESIMNLGDLGAASVDLLNQGLMGTADILVDSFRSTENLGESFKQLGSDLLAQLAKMLVYQALLRGASGALGGIGFAHGGVMRSGSRGGDEPLRLSAYAYGGVARGPQIAVYGETSRPEAYVPLPDGRSIPVTMAASGGDTFNMYVSAIDARSFEQRLAAHPRVYTSAMRRGMASNGGDRSAVRRAAR